jgi:hypothetical protein
MARPLISLEEWASLACFSKEVLVMSRLGFLTSCCVLAWVGGLMVAQDASAAGPWPYGAVQYAYVYPYSAYPPILAGKPIPYYAVHPPVYYSDIVPRPYGYSPYAYVPGIVTPGFEAIGGLSYPCHPGELRLHAPDWQRPARPGEEPAEKADAPARQAGSRPVTIWNEYVATPGTEPIASDHRSPAPLRITNPYFEESEAVSAAVVRAEARPGEPTVVYPMAAAGIP